MQETKISLQKEVNIDKNKAYLIDFSKLNSVNDLVMILSAIGFSFKGDHPFIEQLKPFLNTDNPIDLNPQIEQKSINLPKLKTLK